MEFEKIADEIEKEGMKLSWKVKSKNGKKYAVVGSWQVPKTTAKYLYDLVLKNSSRTVLELGTSIGYSTIWLAKACKGTVYTIDFFKPKIEVAKKNFKRVKLDNIVLIEGMILDVLKDWDKKLDLVFFDADKQRYSEYYELILPWLNDNSIIVVDNAINFKDRMKKFYKYLDEKKIPYEVLGFDNGLLLIKHQL